MITDFSNCIRKYCPKSKYRQSLRGRCDNRRQYSRYASEKQLVLHLLSRYIANVQRETKLSEFLRDSNREKLKITKRSHFCNGFSAMASLLFFTSQVRLWFYTKLPSFLGQAIQENINLSSRTSKPMKMQH